MPQFKILHGAIKTADGLRGPGITDDEGNILDVADLTPKDAKAIDPEGNCLLLKSEWDIRQAGEKAKAEAEAKARAEQAKAEEKAKAEAAAKAKGGGK